MLGYKGFNSDLTCRDFKYEIGETYEIECEPIICERGFHFCEELKDVFEYYILYKKNRFCIVEALGDIVTEHNKSCTNKIKIIRELSLDEILDAIRLKDKDLFKKYYNDEFNEEQMHQIMLGLEYNLDVSIYAKPEFSYGQMHEIRVGLEQGLDVSAYVNPKFDICQMREIRYGLEDNLDVSIYAKPEFNDYQMYQIRLGLEDNLDVSIYAKPEFSYGQMREIRFELKENKT